MDAPTRSSTDKPGWPWWVVPALLVAAWCLYLARFGPRVGVGALAAPELKDAGPDRGAAFDWTLRDLDGKPVAFAQYRGRPVFLNLWATWCPPCVAELPAIAHLSTDARLKDVAFVCAATDGDAEAVRRFLRQKPPGGNLTVLHAGTTIPAAFATDAIPATYIIAPDGRIAVAEVGAAQWDAPEVAERLIALAKASPGPRPGPGR